MQLREYLNKQKIGLPEFAKAINVSVQSVHRYVAGDRIPTLDIMERIRKATNGAVQPNDCYAAAAIRLRQGGPQTQAPAA